MNKGTWVRLAAGIYHYKVNDHVYGFVSKKAIRRKGWSRDSQVWLAIYNNLYGRAVTLGGYPTLAAAKIATAREARAANNL